jgi:membrane protease YdiL (CAAX protease family)
MLFTIKNYLLPTLMLWVTLTGAALVGSGFGKLSWNLELTPAVLPLAFLGLAAVALSDGLLFGGMWLLFRERFLEHYQALIDHFAAQNTADILAGGLLASAEELFFRGVVLEGVANGFGWGAPAGLLISSVLFALAHYIRERKLAPFALWAAWEGMLLGLVYLLSGSLLVSMIVHALHDIGGFFLFAYQRRTGWILNTLWQTGE